MQGLQCFLIKGIQQHYPINRNILQLQGNAIKVGETIVINPLQEVQGYINKWLRLYKRGRKDLANSNTTLNDTANRIQQHVLIVNQFANPYCLETSIKALAKRTPSLEGPTLFSSLVPPLNRLAGYIWQHISQLLAKEANFKAVERVLIEKGFNLVEM